MTRKPKTPAQKRQAKERKRVEMAQVRKQALASVSKRETDRDLGNPIGFHPVTGEPIYANRGPRPKPEKKR